MAQTATQFGVSADAGELRADCPLVAGAYWPNEAGVLLGRIAEMTRTERSSYSVANATVPGVADGERMTPEDHELLDELTLHDRWLLDRPMADGLLTRRSPDEQSADFAETCTRLGFRL